MQSSVHETTNLFCSVGGGVSILEYGDVTREKFLDLDLGHSLIYLSRYATMQSNYQTQQWDGSSYQYRSDPMFNS